MKTISCNVMGVADECLSCGLITDDFYYDMVNNEGRSKWDLTRKLLGEIKNAIDIDEVRFDTFVRILENNLP